MAAGRAVTPARGDPPGGAGRRRSYIPPVPVLPVDPKLEGGTSRRLFAPRPVRPLRPNAAEDLPRYRSWLERRQRQRLRRKPPRPGPPIEVVIGVRRPDTRRLQQCLDSLARQTTANWRLTVVRQEAALGGDDVVADWMDKFGRDRITMLEHVDRRSMAEGCSAAIRASDCPAFLVLDQHDELAPDALALLSAALLEADVAYADEDRVDRNGLAWGPVLKPDWSPELLLSWYYLGHPVAVRAERATSLGSTWPAADGNCGNWDNCGNCGNWEHDLLLRVTEQTERIVHVAEVLCHRQVDPAATDHTVPPPLSPGDEDPTGPAAVVDALARRGEQAPVAPGPLPQTWRLQRRARAGTTVSAIVPFRDNPRLLRSCVDSVISTTSESNLELELVLVDNGSVEPESLTLMEHLAERPEVVLLHDPRPFSWAALNNAAAKTARGDVLLFLNDDVVATRPGWLTALAGQAVRPEVGAAGARLLYPDGGIQHIGVAVGVVGPVSHILAGLSADRSAYLGMDLLAREVSAVTGACLATRREVFERIGPFDEQLAIDYSDVDFCLKLQQCGLRVVYEPQAELVHFESPSRGTSVNIAETRLFIERWGDRIDRGDPFYSPNLTRVDRSAAIGRDRDPLTQWRRTVWVERAVSERSVQAVWAALPGVPAIARSRFQR